MIRLIASDLDGTLLDGPDTVHPDNVEALRDAMQKGVRFAAASGRTAAGITRLMRRHGLEDICLIAANGCQVYDRIGGAKLAQFHLDTRTARQVLAVIASYGLDACLCTETALVYTNEDHLKRDESGGPVGTVQDLIDGKGSPRLAGREALEVALQTPLHKVFCKHLPGQEEAFQQAKAACSQVGSIAMTSSWYDNFEVMPIGVNKGRALALLAAHYGIDRTEVMAFGDNENDLEMLRWAGYGFAMENASESVKDAAALRAGLCAEGGVARQIRTHCGL